MINIALKLPVLLLLLLALLFLPKTMEGGNPGTFHFRGGELKTGETVLFFKTDHPMDVREKALLPVVGDHPDLLTMQYAVYCRQHLESVTGSSEGRIRAQV